MTPYQGPKTTSGKNATKTGTVTGDSQERRRGEQTASVELWGPKFVRRKGKGKTESVP